jgi:hypothetical protein
MEGLSSTTSSTQEAPWHLHQRRFRKPPGDLHCRNVRKPKESRRKHKKWVRRYWRREKHFRCQVRVSALYWLVKDSPRSLDWFCLSIMCCTNCQPL